MNHDGLATPAYSAPSVSTLVSTVDFVGVGGHAPYGVLVNGRPHAAFSAGENRVTVSDLGLRMDREFEIELLR